MDSRLYFNLGDLFANVLAGVIVALACGWLITTGWNMFMAMLVAMALGMLLSLFLWLPVSICFGAMEVMLPVMLTGMVAGMVAGMAAAMISIPNSVLMLIGAFCGLLCINIVWIMNTQMRGTTRYD